jgi:parvulin-like peptidyl-prolyl isomerase
MEWMMLTALLIAQAGDQAQVLDRIAVTVGKTVITEGEVLTNLKVAAFLDQKEPDLSGPSKKAAAARLVDQLLLRREVPSSGNIGDVSVVIADLKKRYSSEAEYHKALEHYGISEQDVIDQLQNGLESVDASNRRFRSEVQVTDEQVHARYSILAKQLRDKGAPSVPTEEASHDQIQDLLVDQGVSDALEKWLEMMRAESSIVYREAVFK